MNPWIFIGIILGLLFLRELLLLRARKMLTDVQKSKLEEIKLSFWEGIIFACLGLIAPLVWVWYQPVIVSGSILYYCFVYLFVLAISQWRMNHKLSFSYRKVIIIIFICLTLIVPLILSRYWSVIVPKLMFYCFFVCLFILVIYQWRVDREFPFSYRGIMIVRRLITIIIIGLFIVVAIKLLSAYFSSSREKPPQERIIGGAYSCPSVIDLQKQLQGMKFRDFRLLQGKNGLLWQIGAFTTDGSLAGPSLMIKSFDRAYWMEGYKTIECSYKGIADDTYMIAKGNFNVIKPLWFLNNVWVSECIGGNNPENCRFNVWKLNAHSK